PVVEVEHADERLARGGGAVVERPVREELPEEVLVAVRGRVADEGGLGEVLDLDAPDPLRGEAGQRALAEVLAREGAVGAEELERDGLGGERAVRLRGDALERERRLVA